MPLKLAKFSLGLGGFGKKMNFILVGFKWVWDGEMVVAVVWVGAGFR